MILQLLGAFIFAGLIVLAAAWPWIAQEMIIRKHEKEEEKESTVDICHCEECGYVGRISFARNGSWNDILNEAVWSCPKCDAYIWDDQVECVWRDEVEAEIAKLKDRFSQKGGAE